MPLTPSFAGPKACDSLSAIAEDHASEGEKERREVKRRKEVCVSKHEKEEREKERKRKRERERRDPICAVKSKELPEFSIIWLTPVPSVALFCVTYGHGGYKW